MSGLPVEKAKIRLYKYDYSNQYALYDSVYTNKEGFATAKQSEHLKYYETVNDSNPNGYIDYLTFYPNRNQFSQRNQQKLQIITDQARYTAPDKPYILRESPGSPQRTLYPFLPGSSIQ